MLVDRGHEDHLLLVLGQRGLRIFSPQRVVRGEQFGALRHEALQIGDEAELAFDTRKQRLRGFGRGVGGVAGEGLGIGATSSFASRLELDRGELVRIRQPYGLSSIDVHAILLAGRRRPSKVRAFIDFLGAALASRTET